MNLTGITYLDFEKAFDLVNHNILHKKLILYLKNESSVSSFHSFLDRKQKVFVDGPHSSLKVSMLEFPEVPY